MIWRSVFETKCWLIAGFRNNLCENNEKCHWWRYAISQTHMWPLQEWVQNCEQLHWKVPPSLTIQKPGNQYIGGSSTAIGLREVDFICWCCDQGYAHRDTWRWRWHWFITHQGKAYKRAGNELRQEESMKGEDWEWSVDRWSSTCSKRGRAINVRNQEG